VSLAERWPAVSLHTHQSITNCGVNRALQSAALELEHQRTIDSLKKGIEHRPNKEELVQRMCIVFTRSSSSVQRLTLPTGNILPQSTAAPAIQGQQKELEKHMRADSLNEKLANRPTPEELLKQGVLEEDPTSPDKLYEERIEEEYAKREGGA
jgi:hypothetical protein